MKRSKSNFYKNKKLSKIDEIDVDKMLVLKKEPCCTKKSIKYFIRYNDSVIRPLCIKLPQMIGYVKHFDSKFFFFYQVMIVASQCLLRLLIISY